MDLGCNLADSTLNARSAGERCRPVRCCAVIHHTFLFGDGACPWPSLPAGELGAGPVDRQTSAQLYASVLFCLNRRKGRSGFPVIIFFVNQPSAKSVSTDHALRDQTRSGRAAATVLYAESLEYRIDHGALCLGVGMLDRPSDMSLPPLTHSQR